MNCQKKVFTSTGSLTWTPFLIFCLSWNSQLIILAFRIESYTLPQLFWWDGQHTFAPFPPVSVIKVIWYDSGQSFFRKGCKCFIFIYCFLHIIYIIVKKSVNDGKHHVTVLHSRWIKMFYGYLIHLLDFKQHNTNRRNRRGHLIM